MNPKPMRQSTLVNNKPMRQSTLVNNKPMRQSIAPLPQERLCQRCGAEVAGVAAKIGILTRSLSPEERERVSACAESGLCEACYARVLRKWRLFGRQRAQIAQP